MSRTNRIRRSSFTLFELLLVLALSVLIVAIAYPVFSKPMANQRLRKSGELIRTVWARARVKAQESGRIQMFHYVPNTDQYYVQPWFAGSEETETNATPWNASQQMDEVAGAFAAAQQPKQLPGGVTFAGDRTVVESRDAAFLEAASATSAGSVQTSNYRPILFYPDGSSSTVSLLLNNEYDSFVRVTLRGLTARSKVSDLLNADEVSQ